jgi:hypothetical protein
MARRLDSLCYERPDTLDRLPCLRHYGGKQMPDMRHARPYFELDLAPCGAHAISHPHRIVAQDFVASYLNDGRRKTRGFAVQW